MGSVTPYSTASGRRYVARWRTPEHAQRQRKGFKTKRDAELYLATVEVSKGAGAYIDPADSRATVGTLGATWLLSRTHLKPSTARVEDGTWRTWVLPRWGSVRISDIRPSEVQAWISGIPRSATVARQAHALLQSILESAVRDRRIPSNPAAGASLPRKGRKPQNRLTHAQVDALAREARDKAVIVRTLAYSGIRWGELSGLRVRDVDAARGRLDVQQNAVAVGGQIIVGTPKTHRTRSVPFPRFLGADLAALAKGKGRDAFLFGRGLSPLALPDVRDGWFAGARRRIAAADDSFPAAVTLHDLRHTAASLAISSGANVKAVQRMLGHASAAMTLDTYADLFEDDLDDVSAALDEARAAAIVSDSCPIEPVEAPRSA